MANKEKIRADLDQFAAAERLAETALVLYGAVKLTENQQPRLVVNATAGLQAALEQWQKSVELAAALQPEASE